MEPDYDVGREIALQLKDMVTEDSYDIAATCIEGGYAAFGVASLLNHVARTDASVPESILTRASQQWLVPLPALSGELLDYMEDAIDVLRERNGTA
ncbi:hypothetical protein JT358_11610 [Micrococcales bacterium 31B]|nr:hypothetical protein [Micrococcales bacterium 31B]